MGYESKRLKQPGEPFLVQSKKVQMPVLHQDFL
jgi:hypothetical protein